ncbi:FUSC family protein [Micromonospora sp. WMMD1120]|uniref:FUSC family protein n=1 Tax=Micromonospora sp. WMMD1120 TaxID=3016106 RepID=UPI0024174EE5|nr:FUSC family protein [Micromonospora sp. WMMD1120]MDG4811100.1 FUSC family protein [Micromonospora sp. WMMD1120]
MNARRSSTGGSRAPLVVLARRLRNLVAGSRSRADRAARLRRRQLGIIVLIAAQAGLAAALSWWLAYSVLGNPNPVFAPTAAVGTIAAAIGQRGRRTLELLIGVGLGIAIGDGLVSLIGTGAWQTGVIVALAIAVALGLAGRGGTVVSQVGGTAVLIATLSSSQQNLELPRIVDAVTGSLVGLVVVALLLPLQPMRVLHRAVAPVFDALAGHLDETQQAIRTEDADRAVGALRGMRAMGPDMERLREALSGAEEVVTVAPARWRWRQHYRRYEYGAEHLSRVITGSRSLARRSATMIEYGENIPGHLPDAVAALADAVRQLQREVRADKTHEGTRRHTLRATDEAGRAVGVGLQNFGTSVATQVRVIASDLLRATGCPVEEANRQVRDVARAAERHGPGEPS